MDMKILQEKEAPLLSRREITAEISYIGTTPKTGDVAALLAANMKADQKLLVVRNIYQDFGFQKAKVIAYHYMSEEDKNRYEPKKKEKKAAANTDAPAEAVPKKA